MILLFSMTTKMALSVVPKKMAHS